MSDPDQPEDRALGASASDAAAFGLVYERLSEPLLAYFFKRTFDADAALELTAETLAVAFDRRQVVEQRQLRELPQSHPGRR